ncbi:IclR family transcriptional regulator [Clostridium sp. Cult2]|uniref:IclR family transcriptional regulator n=1 Tax=Clostridium sp. Cult2 TaxID=2079003 RepID=UPI001F290BB0|nr:IclR family transcriptional regulator [Clostridium sp. Cult2]
MKNNELDRNIIKSVVKALNLLEILAGHEKLGVSELSEITGFGKSTTHRMLNTLKYLNYVDQDLESDDYFVSMKLYELGNKVANKIPIKNIARPHLEMLFNKVNETVNLGVIDNQSVLYLDKIVSKEPLRIELDIGLKVPIYSSALGKTLAAFNNDIKLDNIEYVKHTEKTIDSNEKFYKELEKIRRQGYAFDNEEYIKGLVCIAVPVFNSKNKAVASISVSLPAARLNEGDMEYYVDLLRKCTKSIEKDLFL